MAALGTRLTPSCLQGKAAHSEAKVRLRFVEGGPNTHMMTTHSAAVHHLICFALATLFAIKVHTMDLTIACSNTFI